ncbi:MAG: Rrf2 family transcriptional regulator [Actinobacteria bacterium]|nr:Rrf2 family transcriptional regulator [Actinomycetota bacterium]
MRVTAKADYAVRACLELARHADPALAGRTCRPLTGHSVAEAQAIPAKFLEGILADLRRSGIVRSQRGAEGGYRLARAAKEIAIADIIRAVEGPLADVRGIRPDALDWGGDLEVVQRMWVAVRASLRSVLERVTLADLRDGQLPRLVDRMADDPEAWAEH